MTFCSSTPIDEDDWRSPDPVNAWKNFHHVITSDPRFEGDEKIEVEVKHLFKTLNAVRILRVMGYDPKMKIVYHWDREGSCCK